jgi:hypothetical protein
LADRSITQHSFDNVLLSGPRFRDDGRLLQRLAVLAPPEGFASKNFSTTKTSTKMHLDETLNPSVEEESKWLPT